MKKRKSLSKKTRFEVFKRDYYVTISNLLQKEAPMSY